jgi:hypothetical protein
LQLASQWHLRAPPKIIWGHNFQTHQQNEIPLLTHVESIVLKTKLLMNQLMYALFTLLKHLIFFLLKEISFPKKKYCHKFIGQTLVPSLLS